MKVNDLAFPVLLIADDGWVEKLAQPEFQQWNRIAIDRYLNRKMILIDAKKHLCGLKLRPKEPVSWIQLALAHAGYNPTVPIDLEIQKLNDGLEQLKSVLGSAIEADDDCLTQFVKPEKLKALVADAKSPEEILDALSRAKAI
jgi:hypothetical protein